MEIKDIKETISNINIPANMQSVKDTIRELPDNVRNIADKLPKGLERKVPDAFRRAPKLITPEVHKWLDVAVTGYFAVIGSVFAVQGKKSAATAAFVNAGMIAGVSLMTDYKGNYDRPLSFKMHGTMDAVQAATAAAAPVLHGFADEPEAWFFYGQAINELAVIALTDWDEGERDQAFLMAREEEIA